MEFVSLTYTPGDIAAHDRAITIAQEFTACAVYVCPLENKVAFAPKPDYVGTMRRNVDDAIKSGYALSIK